MLQRGKQCYVARRPDVGPPQRHEKVNVGRPWPDPFDPLQFQLCRYGCRSRHPSQVQFPNGDLLRYGHTVRRLLARESKPSQIGRPALSDRLCGDVT